VNASISRVSTRGKSSTGKNFLWRSVLVQLPLIPFRWCFWNYVQVVGKIRFTITPPGIFRFSPSKSGTDNYPSGPWQTHGCSKVGPMASYSITYSYFVRTARIFIKFQTTATSHHRSPTPSFPQYDSTASGQHVINSNGIIMEQSKIPGTRKPHRKTRNGCVDCKRRRIKVRLIFHVSFNLSWFS
jgi:hypothetical protein